MATLNWGASAMKPGRTAHSVVMAPCDQPMRASRLVSMSGRLASHSTAAATSSARSLGKMLRLCTVQIWRNPRSVKLSGNSTA